jgi:ABC-type dipeptide/oligopeptide/nickel transport system permease component
MGGYVLRRLLGAIPLLLFVSIVVYGLLELSPGGPTSMYLRRGAGMSGEDMAKLEESLGLNDPFYVQYGRWLGNVLTGDFGMATTSSRPVSAERSISGVLPISSSRRTGRRRSIVGVGFSRARCMASPRLRSVCSS